ncbi:MAG: SsrA-binding protein SmpB [Thermoanaerobaculia bacterium]|jgi:SsrA-binding protein|nr:SsrA-binding protein SmpB [Thermoanaerobaculia bacterium]
MSGGKKAEETKVLAQNRKASHDYEMLETFEAGLVLRGTEVKSIRAGKVQLKDSYVEVRNGEAWLVGAHISPYTHGNRENPDPERPRKLLLSRRQIDKLFGRTQLKGQTVIPLTVLLRGSWIKVVIALAQGKKLYDKRAAEKEKTQRREMREAVDAARGR